MIEKCVRWQQDSFGGDTTNLYIVLLTNGKVYIYNRQDGWEERTGRITRDFNVDDHWWKPCSPLEVIVVCGTKGLE